MVVQIVATMRFRRVCCSLGSSVAILRRDVGAIPVLFLSSERVFVGKGGLDNGRTVVLAWFTAGSESD